MLRHVGPIVRAQSQSTTVEQETQAVLRLQPVERMRGIALDLLVCIRARCRSGDQEETLQACEAKLREMESLESDDVKEDFSLTLCHVLYQVIVPMGEEDLEEKVKILLRSTLTRGESLECFIASYLRGIEEKHLIEAMGGLRRSVWDCANEVGNEQKRMFEGAIARLAKINADRKQGFTKIKQRLGKLEAKVATTAEHLLSTTEQVAKM